MGLEIALATTLALLLVLAALLAAAEVSLLRTRRVSVQLDAEQGNRRAAALLDLLDRLPVVLNTILLTVLFTQVSAAAIGGYLAQRWFGGVATTIAAVVVTIVLFVYAEAIPKTLALRAPQRRAMALARPVAVLVRAVHPLTAVLIAAANAQMPGAGASARSAFTEDELRLLAAESAQAGEIDRHDAELVGQAFEFGDRTVADVLIPRDRIVAADAALRPEEALEIAVAAGHRRLPVYRGSLDTILGVVRLRDLATAIRRHDPAPLDPLLRPSLTVGPETGIRDLLTMMQRTGIRFAVVADSAGTTLGIATIEDIAAELLGEIEDPD